jgi:hypothetical protein
MGGIFTIVGALLGLAGVLLVVVAAFRKSLAWGLATLFIPFASLVFALTSWSEAKKGVGLAALGALLMFGGAALAAPASDEDEREATVLDEVEEAPASMTADFSSEPEPASRRPGGQGSSSPSTRSDAAWRRGTATARDNAASAAADTASAASE